MNCKLCGIATKGALSPHNWDAFDRFAATYNKTKKKSKKSGGYRMIQFEFRNGGARSARAGK